VEFKEIDMTATDQTVRDMALEQPSSIRVFEGFGINYCCGGRKSLSDACAEQNIPLDTVIAALEAASQIAEDTRKDWTTEHLAALSAHIVATHHAYVKSELPRLAQLAQKVVNRHGDTQAELPVIQAKLRLLDEELLSHLAKEEAVLFPYIAKLERAASGDCPTPKNCFGTVAHPIAMMTQEHDSAEGLMTEIRTLSQGFTTPPGACPTYLAFYDGLREFSEDLHQHIHLENNILFPRAIALEASSTQS
jgi:regulator of cell morphogenesis and NO signaling